MDTVFTSRRRASWREHFVAVARAVEVTARAAVATEPSSRYDARLRSGRPGIGQAGWLCVLDRPHHPAA
jgi:hypothetical protein